MSEAVLSLTDEWVKCTNSAVYFAQEYVYIFSSEDEDWVKLDLWPFQIDLLDDLVNERRILLLKARQLGFTTIALVYLMWRFVFHSAASIGLFSKGELEAMDLLKRLVKMYHKLPKWMQADFNVSNNAHLFEESNGSWVRAMSTKKGESFTFKYLLLDEFDRFENSDELMRNVKPAADAGKAQIIAGSISDKDRPESIFKNMYRAAEDKEIAWKAIFYAWFLRPGRDRAWYEDIVKDAMARYAGDEAGAMDEVFQQYPSNAEEALSPRKQGKRVPYVHIQRVYVPQKPISGVGEPAIPGLRVYVEPKPPFTKYQVEENNSMVTKERLNPYVVAADPAEGVEGGSDSACRVLDKNTGEEVAAFEGKHEPRKDFPSFLFQIAKWYNDAGVLVERNNHGHAVLGELTELIARSTSRVEILLDPFDLKEGWLTSPSGTGRTRGKTAMYDTGAQHIKDMLGIIHDKKTVNQLADIDIMTYKAATGRDDCSDAYVLACVARTLPGRTLTGKLFF